MFFDGDERTRFSFASHNRTVMSTTTGEPDSIGAVAWRARWAVAFAVLAALAIPWFLWGVDAVVAGLPVWVWWHVGWLCLASLTFWAFAARAWGAGIVARPDGATRDEGGEA